MRTMLALLIAAATPTVAQARGHVYIESNAAAGNEVLVFDRHDGGALTLAGSVATGGLGNGGSLGSQSALASTPGGRWLLAVNAGSNDVSVFSVGPHGLTLASRTPTAGQQPVSVAVDRDRVYVLDAGGDGDVTAFHMAADGTLSAIGRAPLANRASGPAQVAVTPDGGSLVVTEKATSCIDTLPLDDAGVPGAATCHPSAGTTPFGFAFAAPEWDWFGNRFDRLVVSEAAGGAPNASTVSTYLVANGDVEPLAPAVRTEQTAACWIALAHGGRYVYTTVAGSDAVTGFRLHDDGALALLTANGRTGETGAGSHPTDADVAGGYLYVLDSGTNAVSVLRVRGDGSLEPASTVAGLPASAAGLIAR